MKIRPLEAELSHADGWTDRRRDRQDVANSRFSQFTDALKIWRTSNYFSPYCGLRSFATVQS